MDIEKALSQISQPKYLLDPEIEEDLEIQEDKEISHANNPGNSSSFFFLIYSNYQLNK